MAIDRKTAHGILLDAESNGIFDVQGNSISAVCRYLSDYIQQQKNASNLSIDAIRNINQFDDLINGLANITSQIDVIHDLAGMHSVIANIMSEVEALPLEKPYLLPGGWRNKKGPGHAMIYEIKKNQRGDILFSIYNSGAGINYHAQFSTPEKELFFSIQTFQIEGDNKDQLGSLLEDLILANKPKFERNFINFDEEKLYTLIQKHMIFLDANQILPSESAVSRKSTTSGQISGTCTQRVLHQMLKANFETLPEYQRFIFDFKMYALRDYIRSFDTTEITRQETRDIILAIENNLKILHQPGVFENADEKLRVEGELVQLKEHHLKNMPLSDLPPKRDRLKNIKKVDKFGTHGFKLVNDVSYEISKPKILFVPDKVILDHLELLLQIERQIVSLKHPDYDPYLALDAIEEIVIQLPLPETEAVFNQPLHFYSTIESTSSYTVIIHQLEELISLYNDAIKRTHGEKKQGDQLVIEVKLISLYDYFSQRYTTYQNISTFHSPLYFIARGVLDWALNESTMMITRPELVTQLLQLKELYCGEKREVCDALDFYKALVASEVDAKLELEKKFVETQLSCDIDPDLLKKNDLTALYYLLNQLDFGGQPQGDFLLTSGLKFDRLLEKLKFAVQLEVFIKEHYLSTKGQGALFSWKRSNDEIVEFKCPTKVPEESLPGIIHQYRSADRAIESTLLRAALLGKKTENEIQVSYLENSDREIMLIRCIPSLQIQLTLSYFKSHLACLSKRDYQNYFLLNLFTPGLLTESLKTDVFFIDYLDAFFDDAFKYYSDERGVYTKESIVLIHINFLLERYMMEHALIENRQLLFRHRLKRLMKRIQQQLDTPLDKELQLQLQRYLFLTTVHAFLLDDEEDYTTVLMELFPIFFRLSNDSLPSSNFEHHILSFELEYTKQHFHLWLKELPHEQLKTLVTEQAKKMFKILDTEFNLEGDAPIFYTMYQTDKYQVDVSQGVVYKNGFALVWIPSLIRDNPILKELGLENETSCFRALNGNKYEFYSEKFTVSITLSQTGIESVYKKFRPEGREEQWYQLQINQPNIYNISRAVYIHDIQELFYDIKHLIWISLDGNHVFITKNGYPDYSITYKDYWHFVSFDRLDKDGKETGYIIDAPNAQYYENILSVFDSPSFFSVELARTKDEGDEGYVLFYRYGLQLHLIQKKIFLPDTNYQLLASEKDPVSDNIAHLTFSNDTQQQCLIPIQRYYVDPNQEQISGQYYDLIHDISNTILSKKTNICLPQNLEQSERYVTYPVVNGQLIPHSAAEGLYLCYLYLGLHDEKNAWDTLEMIRHQFFLEGSAEELRYLSWIINGLPVMLKDTPDDAEVVSPRVVACKLKALALYTDFLSQGGTPSLPSGAQKKEMLLNDVSENLDREAIESLHKSLHSIIRSNYLKFTQMKRHLSRIYTLTEDERHSLLTQLHKRDPVIGGTLSYEWRELCLKKLIAELHQLDIHIKSYDQNVPPFFIRRHREIEEQLAKETAVMKKQTILEEVSIDVSLPKEGDLEGLVESIDLYTVKSLFYHNLLKDDFKQEAIDALSIKIEKKDFLQNFSIYLQIANTPLKNEAAYTKIKLFCGRVLRADHCFHEKDQALITYLCKLLYCVLENPGCLDKALFRGLDAFIKELEGKKMSRIKMYQTKEIFTTPFIETQQLITQLKQQTHTPEGLDTELLNDDERLESQLEVGSDDIAFLKSFRANYERQYVDYLEKLKVIQELAPDEQEIRAGVAFYDCLSNQRKISIDLFQDKPRRDAIHIVAMQYLEKSNAEQTRMWGEILIFANQILNEQYHTEIASSQKRLLTENDLRKIYLHADLALYRQETEQTDTNCKQLHSMIHRAVIGDIHRQHVYRLVDALSEVNETWSDFQSVALGHLIMATLSESEPCLMLFQYLSGDNKGILLRPQQIEALKTLLSTPQKDGFVEIVEKVTMGGGKSKVLLPLLAQKKATGKNLVLVEVPRSLLKTNHMDLNNSSMCLFGQRAFKFEFSRESDSSSFRLQQIYEQFIDVMNNQNFIVTTGESIQSIELKYLELLLNRPEKEREIQAWKEKMIWMSKIVSLLKEQGDVVIDEVHQGLLLKRKLNYTIGAHTAVPNELIRFTLNLYQFLDRSSGITSTEEFIQGVINDPCSPLHDLIRDLINQYGEDVIRSLSDYFNNKNLPYFIENIDSDQRQELAFYKEQATLVFKTLGRKYKENYGSSKRQDLSVAQRTLAIPYRANDKPSEYSRFGNPLETLNFTVQSLITEGLNADLLILMIEQWQIAARLELENNSILDSLDETLTGKEAFEYLNVPLSLIDVTNKGQIAGLLSEKKYSRTLIYRILEECVLNKVTVEPCILHSDSFNHVDLYPMLMSFRFLRTNNLKVFSQQCA